MIFIFSFGVSAKASELCASLLQEIQDVKTKSVSNSHIFVFESRGLEVKFLNFADQELRAEDLAEAAFAMSLVWERHVHENARVEVDVFKKMKDTPHAAAAYLPVEDRFELAIGNLDRFLPPLSLKKKLIILMSHEMTHRVQKRRGHLWAEGNAKLAATDRDAYADQEVEVEANMESLHVVKFMYPESSGYFLVGSRKFEIPQTSWYR